MIVHINATTATTSGDASRRTVERDLNRRPGAEHVAARRAADQEYHYRRSDAASRLAEYADTKRRHQEFRKLRSGLDTSACGRTDDLGRATLSSNTCRRGT